MSAEVTTGTIGLHVSERFIPVPQHLSEAARNYLSYIKSVEPFAYPAIDDHDQWRVVIAERDAMIMGALEATNRPSCTVRNILYEGISGYEVTPEELSTNDRRIFLDFHGGGLIMGAGKPCEAMAVSASGRVGAKVYSPDYRMAPDHPYPAAVNDCLTYYRMLLETYHPEDIIVGGVSAGGNLAAAVVLRARDEGLPLPAGCVLYSPELDLTESGDSFHTSLGIDPTGLLIDASRLYAAGHDLAHPYLSPLFGDFTKGFPPTIITAGTRDEFLSNAVRMHRSLRDADVYAELHVLEAAPHGGFGGGTPEEASLDRDIRAFCDARWAKVG